MTGFTALLIFVILSLLLAMTYAGYRVPQIFLGNKKANHWERNQPVDDPAFLVRAKGAHLNCLENLPLFAALVLTAAATGQ
ncbi:MAG: MAPEG family protein, partial [Alloalcanivorax venustensis]